ncbi:MAG: polynucleotide adenylyltransferase PcnB [Planctomycetota bacterium]
MSRRSSKPGAKRDESQSNHGPTSGPRSGREEGRGGRRRKRGGRGTGDDARWVPAETIDPSLLDGDALRVVKRLQKHDHEAYFVGGCVRDLFIGRRPKDFDVATSARPSEIRALFRNCRIIGRRFKLAHIFYGDHIIETATFRAAPGEQPTDDADLLIVDDNVYGTAAEDARRRDFTVNALFLDPTSHEILDHVGGIEDLERRTLRTIGDPEIRLAEDPVRILRAVKFATRLDLEIDDPTWDAMCDVAPDLAKAAPPRILEELLRLCRSGTATAAFQMLRDCGALAVLVPQLEEYLGPEDDIPERAEPFWDLLAALDAHVQMEPEDVPSTAVLVALLFALPYELALDDQIASNGALDARARADVAWDLLEPLSEATRLSRKDFARARRILVAQQNFVSPPERFSELLFARSEEFVEAFELFRLRSQARGVGLDLVEAWRERWQRARRADPDEIEDERRRTRKRRRRRRKRGRRRSSGGS